MSTVQTVQEEILTMTDEPLNVRLVTHGTASLLQRIDDYRFANRIGGRAEAMRQLIELGLSTGDDSDQERQETADGAYGDGPNMRGRARDAAPAAAPTIPSPDECGRPVMGELILPWLRSTGKDRYELGEVLAGVFKESTLSHAPGRDKAVENLFKAIGWKRSASKQAGVQSVVFLAPAVSK
jgi:hypothetical protein